LPIVNAILKDIVELENNIFIQRLYAPEISSKVKPGQFVNIRVSETIYPLLRRPFSVCDCEDGNIFIMFNVFGEGTKMLASKKPECTIDTLGPLGNGFNLSGDYDTAVIVAGGLGAAPFPFLLRELGDNKRVICFVGGRTHKDIITYRMKNVYISTDDGSMGKKGNVVELLEENIELLKRDKIKIFACGPNAMLRALKEFTVKNDFECEASTECAMACGFGICQGCPIESTKQKDKYLLVCKDGPVFNVRDVVI
jgi:dihydroorotate dehydrogenase electron transfer subunit